MKTRVLILTLALITTLSVCAQDDVTNIFDDLDEFDPAPAPATPTLTIPRPEMPEAAPLTIQLPVAASPVVYAMDASAGTFVSAEKLETPLEPLNIEGTLSQGKEAYADDDWNHAQKLFEAVLEDDAYNKDAIRWLRRIANKKAGLETKSYDTTRVRMLENVQAAWNAPKAEGEQPKSNEPIREPTENELRATALLEKLESIRIPAIAFQDADIQQVVLELSALCRKLDPERKGANLVVFGTSETLLPSVTFSGTDLSALETLDIITQMSGMKYDIGPNMVSLTPVNYEPPQQMISTEFDIMAPVGTKMALMLGEQEGTSGLLDVRGFFSTVPFPPTASAQYNPDFNILLVRNVPKYIAKVEALLERYNQKAREERSQQVEIETKFIEVAEGALDELGFEWTFVTDPDVNNDNWKVEGDQNLFTDTLRTGLEAFSTPVATAGRATAFNSLANAVVDPTGAGLINEAGKLIIQKGDRINLLIKALERQAGSDLLSAPKVLTKSGETASIHVGEVRSFPTAYDVIIERYAQPSLLPLDYEEYKTGVMLEVTPELDPENGTIDMKLSPEIKELAGFDEQHVGTIWPSFGDEQINMGTTTATAESTPSMFDFLTAREKNRTVNADRLIARQPVFKTRKVDTTITIEDGSTIVMGGLIKEKLETFKDSVPILGRIPFIGRLFRSEGERTVKRNLMIFVTANQVDASGYKKNAE